MNTIHSYVYAGQVTVTSSYICAVLFKTADKSDCVFVFLQQDKLADLSKKKQGHNRHDTWLSTLQHQTPKKIINNTILGKLAALT